MICLAITGCSEGVGTCDDPYKGHDTVLVGGAGGSLQYGGQAVLNVACAGCHGSEVTGKSRRGAPAGLDFDLFPVTDLEDDTTNMGGQAIAKLPDAQVTALRNRQRLVFEQRDVIWQQVTDGLMPPDGIGAVYRRLKNIFNTKEESPCLAAKAGYKDITEKPPQDVLRSWLACGAPIVEANTDKVDAQEGVAGLAGFQYPVCEGGDAGTGEEVAFETVYEQIIDTSCTGCHSPGATKPDLSTVDKAYAAFVEDDGIKCTSVGLPYVTPGVPEASYLYTLVTEERPGCGGRMPSGMPPLSSANLRLIRDWIASGALRADELEKSRRELDAGLP